MEYQSGKPKKINNLTEPCLKAKVYTRLKNEN